MDINSKAYSYIENTFGSEVAKDYKTFSDISPVDYIRINLLKTNFEKIRFILISKYNIKIEEVEGLSNAVKVISDENNLIGKTLEHTLGLYYIQSLSSMLPAYLLNPNPEEKVLDLCAAPGSKTTQLSEIMKNNGTLIANEIDAKRIRALVFNIDRLNIINTGVINSKGELLSKIYDNYFDKTLVDAPCSSLGIIQKRSEVTNWWSIEHSERLHNIQLKLLVAAIKMTKPGGTIIYSTCTLSIEENELVIDKVLKNYPVELCKIEIPFSTLQAQSEYRGIKFNSELQKAHRIFPWEINSDGFFIVKLIKTDSTDPLEKISFPKSDLKLISYKNKLLNRYLVDLTNHFGINPETLFNFNFLVKGKDIYLTDKNWSDENLNQFNRIGTKFGSFDSRDKITLHSNAAQVLSDSITKRIYQIKNVSDLEKYISGSKIEANQLDFGQYLVKFGEHILGTAINSPDGLKSRFPKTKRTQKIELH